MSTESGAFFETKCILSSLDLNLRLQKRGTRNGLFKMERIKQLIMGFEMFTRASFIVEIMRRRRIYKICVVVIHNKTNVLKS